MNEFTWNTDIAITNSSRLWDKGPARTIAGRAQEHSGQAIGQSHRVRDAKASFLVVEVAGEDSSDEYEHGYLGEAERDGRKYPGAEVELTPLVNFSQNR